MRTFREIGTAIGALVTEKNAAYGSSFETVGAAMRLLYPRGIAPEQMDDALLLTRIWDKMMRIATDRDALGESPYGDIAGYGILGVSMHQYGAPPDEQKRSQEGSTAACAGSARSAVEASQTGDPNEEAASAAINVSERITPLASLRHGLSSTPQLMRQLLSDSEHTDALAPTAMAHASAAAAVLERGRAANERGICAFCEIGWDLHWSHVGGAFRKTILFCDKACGDGFAQRFTGAML